MNNTLQRFVLGILCCSLFNFHPLAFGQEIETKAAGIKSEADLVAIITSASESKAEKAMACKRLAIYGSQDAADELAALLSDEQLCSWARIALEAIPGEKVDEALRSSLGSLQGNQLAGVINSIGVRKDAKAVVALIGKLGDSQTIVATSAAGALGRIGGQDAAKGLVEALQQKTGELQSAAAEGLVLCAEKFLATGDKASAISTYDTVRAAKLPKQRIVEATRGAIVARGEEGVPMLVDLLRSEDRTMFALGLGVAREIQGENAKDALVKEIAEAKPQRASLIVQALSERVGGVDLPTIIDIASKGPLEVRAAAIAAIGRVGDATTLDALLKFATENSSDLGSHVKAALVAINDEKVSSALVEKLASAPAELKKLLIETVGLRRVEATDQLVAALDSSDNNLRTAALEALGQTVPQSKLGLLVDLALNPKNTSDSVVASRALQTAAIRMPDREAAAAELVAVMEKSPVETKVKLLEILGGMGGKTALEAMAKAARDSDTQLKDASSRLLGDWMTIDAAPVLLELAKTGPADKFQVREMRGYIRIARQFVMPEKERVQMCKLAMEAAKQPAEKKLVLEILERYPSINTLKLAIEAMNQDELKKEATLVVESIGKKLGDNEKARELLQQAGVTIPN